MRVIMLVLLGVLFVQSAVAQDYGRAEREASLQMSRYEQAIGKLQQQNEQLQSDVRSLQRTNAELQKSVEAVNGRMQGIADDVQRFQNTDVLNIQNSQKQIAGRIEEIQAKGPPWGDAQRDCSGINVKHQQIKVAVKPDGTRGVRYLCFDGKALLLGNEVYNVE
jgi:hypothetical protein